MLPYNHISPIWQALDFVQQTVYVYTVSWLWTKMSRASRQHWENLAAHDPARNDVRTMLATVCGDTTESHYLWRWDPPPIPDENVSVVPHPSGCASRGTGSSATKNSRMTSGCGFAQGSTSCLLPNNHSSNEPMPIMLIVSHALDQMFPHFGGYMAQIWGDICRHCHLKCSKRAEGGAYTLPESQLLIDNHISLPLAKFDEAPHRLVLYSWDPGKMGRFFHYNGNLLETIGVTERIVAQVNNRPVTSMNVRVNQEMRNGGGFLYSWRKALGHLGFSKPAIAKIIQAEISKYERNWTRDLVAHMTAFKAG